MSESFEHPKQKNSTKHQTSSELPKSISYSLSANLTVIQQITGDSTDIIIRLLKMGIHNEIRAAIVYIAGLVDEQAINDFLLEPMINNPHLQEKLTQKTTLETIAEEGITLSNIKLLSDWNTLLSSFMSGETIILVDGLNSVLSASAKGGEKRSIQEPSTQQSVRGSRESFTESLGTNTAMVRRIVKSPDLWIESMKIGKVTKTDVAIMYLNGIADNDIIEEVRTRLKNINIDSILESGYIEQLIEDQTMTTFPTLYHTERPDIVAGNLLEGRIAIFVDGTPFVLLAPALFIQFFQAIDDYYVRFDIATALRLLRILIFFISLIAPASYIAATTFHQEMIPTQLLVVVAAQRESVPFPAFIEALIMEITFEILREAGVRMPKAIGSAVSIVGALVIGQAAVQAGIVSPAMVIIVAITAIASFATPAFSIAISARLIRFLFMLVAATFGFYGIILGIIILTVHLCSLRSFGIPYTAPFAPFIPANLKDTFVRAPWWLFKQRPELMRGENAIRQGKNQRPKPPKNRGMVSHSTEKGDQNES